MLKSTSSCGIFYSFTRCPTQKGTKSGFMTLFVVRFFQLCAFCGMHSKILAQSVLCLSLFVSSSAAERPESLQLEIQAPPELTAVRMRLEAMPPSSFADIAQFLGIAGSVSQPATAI